MNKTKVMAHRGASAYAPENTLQAFTKAMEMGADGLELDVHLSKDGHLVVIHDEKINRTSNGRGAIKDYTLAELKEFDVGSWFNKDFTGATIPTLAEVLDLIDGWEGVLNIEIKRGYMRYPGLEEKLLELLKSRDMTADVIFSSFNHYCLTRLKELDPSSHVGLCYKAVIVEPWLYAKRIGADALHSAMTSMVPEIVEGCKENGIILRPFTKTSEEDMRVAYGFEVDTLIIDNPDRAIEVRDS